jgi:hypothetical protein
MELEMNAYDRMLLNRDTESRAMENVRMFFGASYGAPHQSGPKDGWIQEVRERLANRGPSGRIWEALWNLITMHAAKAPNMNPANGGGGYTGDCLAGPGAATDVFLFNRSGALWAWAPPELQTGEHQWWEWEPVLIPQEPDRSNPRAEMIRWRARSARAVVTWNAQNNPVNPELPGLYPKWCCDAYTGSSLV